MDPAVEPTVKQLLDQLAAQLSASSYLQSYPILPLARPSIRLQTTQVQPIELGLGESRIGGLPDVPPKFVWPRWKPKQIRQDRYGADWDIEDPMPLTFLAQIDLSEIPSIGSQLPNTGWLYFFYDGFCEPWGFDPNDRGSCRVVYSNCDREDLSRAKWPDELPDEFRYYYTRLTASIELTLPQFASEIPERPPASEKYQELRESLAAEPADVQHRLLGHPQEIQNPMEVECQRVTNGFRCGSPADYAAEGASDFDDGAADWRLLLQIDSDDAPSWMWGDCGRLYFWIRRQDLAARDFSNVWLILQCS